MRILVACEESQAVTTELRQLGHEAYSCDILPTSGEHPEWHIQQDVSPLLGLGWDMVLAFPPCTHLAISGAKWFEQKRADGRQAQGVNFFMQFADLPHIPKVVIENPISIMSSLWRKPDQKIQPWQFGDPFQKTTCLWLKGVPKLVPTNVVDKGAFYISPNGKRLPKWYSDNTSKKVRSKTFPGIAKAMALQWAGAAVST